MAHDPFSAQQTDPRPNPNSSKPANASKVWLVLGIIAGSMLVICCGFAGLSVIAMRSYTHPADTVDLAERKDTHSDDSNAFRASIYQLSEKTGQLNEKTGQQGGSVSLTNAENNNPNIDKFVKEVLDKIDRNDDVPFNVDMFIEAIDASHYYHGSMNFVERLTMATWLRQYEPVPDSFDEYHRVIGFRRVGDRLAEVDLLFYSENNQSMSVRWFLINGRDTQLDGSLDSDGPWEIYDHARLEDGRRKSDEYANYLKGDELVSEGYDEAINEAYEISADWDRENSEESISKLKECESTRMLADDRDVILLHFSYIYLDNDEEAEAIRVLKKIQNPDRMWGVWPMMAICYSNLEDFDNAIGSIKKAERQIPGHPRNRWLRAVIDSAMDHKDSAADHNAAALAMMPQDTSLYWSVAGKHRIADIPVLVGAADFAWKQRRSMSVWLALVDATASDVEFANEVAQTLENRKLENPALQNLEQTPKGIEAMVTASAAWADDDPDIAAKLFLRAYEEAELDEIKQAARDNHQQCRLADKDFGTLLSETDDLDGTLLTMLSWAYDEEFDDAAHLLMDDLKNPEAVANPKLADHSIKTALLGWAHLQLGQHETALQKLDLFHRQFASANNHKFSDDEDWVTDFVDTMAAQCLLSLGRSDDIVKRFENEPWRFDQISDWFISKRDTAKAMEFLNDHKDDSRDMMRLQSLKLKALLATSTGDEKESSRIHSEAVLLGERIEESQENYWPGDLLRNYTRDMVLLKALPKSVVSPSEQFCQQIISEAESVEDGKLIRAWTDETLRAPGDDPPRRLRIAKSLGDYHLSQGDFKQAVKAFTVPSEPEGTHDHDSRYLRKSLSDAKILSQLAISDFDAARKTLEEREESVGYSSIDISPLAIADLAAWDVSSLRKHFHDLNTSEVASWLVEAPRRRFFEQNSDERQFDELLSDYPMPIGYHQPQQVGRLVFSSNQGPAIEGKAIEAACSDALTGPASVEATSTVKSDAAWIVTTDAGDRILIASGEMVLSPSTLDLLKLPSSDNQQPTGGKHSQSILMIAILDYKPEAGKRIFDISQRLASRTELNQETNWVIAFSHSGRVWTGQQNAGPGANTTSLADQLRWEDRVPVNFQTLDYYLASETISDSDQSDIKKSRYWSRTLKNPTTPPDIFAKHACGDIWEELPVELLSVDKQNSKAMVRLKASSALSSYLRAGKTCTCQTNNLRQANP